MLNCKCKVGYIDSLSCVISETVFFPQFYFDLLSHEMHTMQHSVGAIVNHFDSIRQERNQNNRLDFDFNLNVYPPRPETDDLMTSIGRGPYKSNKIK